MNSTIMNNITLNLYEYAPCFGGGIHKENMQSGILNYCSMIDKNSMFLLCFIFLSIILTNIFILNLRNNTVIYRHRIINNNIFFNIIKFLNFISIIMIIYVLYFTVFRLF